MSTTLTLSPIKTKREPQKQQQFYQPPSNTHSPSQYEYSHLINNNNNNTVSFYQFEKSENAEAPLLPRAEAACADCDGFITLLPNNADEEEQLLAHSSRNAPKRSSMVNTNANAIKKGSFLLHKSHSYNGSSFISNNSITTKSTVLKQDVANGRIATSLTGSESEFALLLQNEQEMSTEGTGLEETDAFLMPSVNNNSSSSSATTTAGDSGNTSSTASQTRRNRARNAFCFRAHAFINRNWYLSYLVPLSILCALMIVAYLMRDYAKRLLYWIETQNPWIIFAVFLILFIAVSFPVVVGYFILMITAGYLFGCFKGLLTVILGANLGIAIAHVTIRSFRHRIPLHKLIKNETGRAILRVIAGPKAFKVVLFTRLTPIPFGIQNAIFGVSSINSRVYHSATVLGLLPAQLVNVYLGSTLRSMHEVLNNKDTAVTGYVSFVVEVICGIGLMYWVVQKARKELSETLLSDMSNEGKLIDIEV